jgi:hypothetical protein
MKTTDARIRPWAGNRRYWQYKGKPVLLLGGTREDNLFQIPDLREHLDELAAAGGNYIRNTMSDRDEGNVYPYRRLPDGRYDLDQWCDEYWQRFETMLRLTEKREIIVQIEVWDRFDLTDAKGLFNWQRHPYNPANNVNYPADATGLADEYPDHPVADKHPFYHTIPGMDAYYPGLDRIRPYQERFVGKLLDHSLPHGNVLYCMNNETSTDPVWGQYWMRFIRQRADEAGVDVYVTDMFDDMWKAQESENLKLVLGRPDLYDFLDVSQVNSRNFGQQHWDRLSWIMQRVAQTPRPVNHTKIYSAGETSWGSGTPQDGIERFWHNLLLGSASARFHRPTAGIGLNRTARACIRAAREVERLVSFWDLQLHMELLSDRAENGAYLAADPGNAYVLFLPFGERVRLDTGDADVSLNLNWIDVRSGQRAQREDCTAAPATEVGAPSDGPWVAVIIRGTK